MNGYSTNALERLAKEYADLAIMSERKGKYEDAIKYYKKAAEVLKKIITLNRDIMMKETYIEYIKEYEKRAEFLEKNLQKLASGPQEGSQAQDVDIDLLVSPPPNITFNDIVGIEDVKKVLKRSIVYPIKRPDLYPKEIGWSKGVLLFGPPGNGKTMLAGAIAREINAAFISVDAASIMSKWLGDAEKNVSKVFSKAREIWLNKGVPVIIFIDEVDSLMGIYSTEVGGEVRVRNQFLKEMDGIHTKGSSELIFVIGATNKPWVLDMAFIRRFQKRIYVPPPDKETRKMLFKYYTKSIKIAEDVDFDHLAEITEGYSASDIKDIVRDAYEMCIEEMFEKSVEEPPPLSMKHLKTALSKRSPSISQDMIKVFIEWNKKFGAI